MLHGEMEISQLIQNAAAAGYLLLVVVLAVYALHAYGVLAVLLRFGRVSRFAVNRRRILGRRSLEGDHWPHVLTQIPMYNEATVAARVMRAAAAMDYPGHHTIQVLDDSTDETRGIVDRCASDLVAAGCEVQVVRRPSREGYKAGALAYGLQLCEAPFVAVFDADFVPSRDFLLETIPCFTGAPEVGFVQGRWTFLNDSDSMLTRAQAVALDSHFAVEQAARSAHPSTMMSFNGTAGVWRRAAIDDAGGWSAETLTEDLDLSCRVQLRGWKGIFLPGLEVPGELPSSFSSFKSQQFRWAKGAIQVAIRTLPDVWRSPLPWITKCELFFHLTQHIVYPLLLAAILLGPLAWSHPGMSWVAGATGLLFFCAAIAPMIVYAVGQRRLYPGCWCRLARLPFTILSVTGLAAANARAVLEAAVGHQTAFIRTPKNGERRRARYRVAFPVAPHWEILLSCYVLGGAAIALVSGNWGGFAFALLAAVSFGYLGLASLLEVIMSPRIVAPKSPS